MNIKNQQPTKSLRSLVVDIVGQLLANRCVFDDNKLVEEVVRDLKNIYSYEATVEEVMPFIEAGRNAAVGEQLESK